MAYTSLDNMTAELAAGKFWRADWQKITGGTVAYTAGNWYDFTVLAGNPVADLYPGTALTGTVPTESSGLYHGGNVSPATKQVLNASAFSAIGTAVPGVLMLVDVAKYYPGINLLSAVDQILPAGAALTRYTDGKGLRAFVTVTALTGTPAGTPVQTLTYTRATTGGTDTGRSLGAVINYTVGAANVPTIGKITHSGVAANNHAPFLPLAAGDLGIRSADTFRLTTAYTGASVITAALVLCKPLLTLPLVTLGVAAERNTVFQIPSNVKIENGACLRWLYFAGAGTATNTSFMGSVDFGWA